MFFVYSHFSAALLAPLFLPASHSRTPPPPHDCYHRHRYRRHFWFRPKTAVDCAGATAAAAAGNLFRAAKPLVLRPRQSRVRATVERSGSLRAHGDGLDVRGNGRPYVSPRKSASSGAQRNMVVISSVTKNRKHNTMNGSPFPPYGHYHTTVRVLCVRKPQGAVSHPTPRMSYIPPPNGREKAPDEFTAAIATSVVLVVAVVALPSIHRGLEEDLMGRRCAMVVAAALMTLAVMVSPLLRPLADYFFTDEAFDDM